MTRSRRDLLLFGFFALLLALLALLVSCTPDRPSQSEAMSDINNMVFVRHPNGLCFGEVRFFTSGGYQGVSITNVPSSACEK
jgi:hypothetical protein